MVRRPAFLLFALLLAPAAVAGVDPGNWEFTVEVSISGNTTSSGPIVKTRCIGDADARDPQKVLADSGATGCKFLNTHDTGSEYTFTIDCGGGAVPVHGSGHVSYTADTLEGAIDLVADQPNLSITTHSNLRARRLGPCNS